MAEEIKINVPDIGGAHGVEVIEILVHPHDEITVDTPLITLESDKASMEIPSPTAGKIVQLLVNIGDKVSQGDGILTLQTKNVTSVQDVSVENKPLPQEEKKEDMPSPFPQITKETIPSSSSFGIEAEATTISASPAVRRMIRELGIRIEDLTGTGRKARITKEDVQQYVKNRLAEQSSASGANLPDTPVIDFSQFGTIDMQPLNKIKRLTGLNMHRSWITIPQVTQCDEADITELEAFRLSQSEHALKDGYKLTMLAFVTKVVSKALATFPMFNASLDKKGEHLIYKRYFNIGIAVETPNGLVVPVIKQVDQLSVGGIAIQMGQLSKKAREKGLSPAEMSGGCFTISSLGGIGGTSFTPIVNGPEVAILGLSRAVTKPVYDGSAFKPRLMLPLSLSYDHRVIDGAEAARFTRYVADLLCDIRRIIL